MGYHLVHRMAKGHEPVKRAERNAQKGISETMSVCLKECFKDRKYIHQQRLKYEILFTDNAENSECVEGGLPWRG